MIAIDMDGTLLCPDGLVTPRTREAIHRAIAQGIVVCFATGRNFTESQAVLEAVAHYDHAVFVSGAMVVDTKQGVTLHRTLMDGNLARRLSAFLEDRRQAVLALQDANFSGVDYHISEQVPINDATRKWLDITLATVQFRSDLATASHEHTIRIGIVSETQEVNAIVAELRATFGDRILCHGMKVQSYGVQVLEIFDPAVNKWEGILHVARRHKISPARIIAVGDDVNDLPMISRAGLGVAMGNARPEVQAAASLIINSNRNDGLARFIETVLDNPASLPPSRHRDVPLSESA